MTQRAIVDAVDGGALIRLSRGLYVSAADWRSARTEQRELLHVAAAQRRLRLERPLFVLSSAAALHGLPLARASARGAHIASARSNGRVRSRNPLVARHEIEVAEADVVEVDGICCTSVTRTVADLARLARPETALAAADAALRAIAWDHDDHVYDDNAAEAYRSAMLAHLRTGARGVVQARRLLTLADGRADRPGESISRLYLHEIGFRNIRPQVPVAGPHGSPYWLDFSLDDADVWAEFDGLGKYVDDAFRRQGESADDVVLREKEREDWIRGATGRRVVRWNWEHIASADTLAARLAAFGIRPRP
ncbi:hypothetical protein [Microbacterium telephonicum]|uniref:Transcriptional regulator, AbiEi antitoxin, Type IV TA system n=1 Tax=Microbacterium telephonicum TaxID=1714841 RepID=A0A498C5Y6_9MICO|nr:hypothetical protein [Microbacterium telephonicum]RLK47998.1 hypothetical protein C7474_2600 [Microbacterium telephonicum]